MPGGLYSIPDHIVNEIRRLRMQDPELWKIQSLADKFGYPKGTVSKICNRRIRRTKIDIYKNPDICLRSDN